MKAKQVSEVEAGSLVVWDAEIWLVTTYRQEFKHAQVGCVGLVSIPDGRFVAAVDDMQVEVVGLDTLATVMLRQALGAGNE